jgi:DNA-binding MarR family transcriptional regulator
MVVTQKKDHTACVISTGSVTSHMMDSMTFISDVVSVIFLVSSVLTARWALHGFRQSRQALREAASYVTVIVGALSSRIESTETVVNQLRSTIAADAENTSSQEFQASLRAKYEELYTSIQELASNDKRILQDFEQLESRLMNQRSKIEQRKLPSLIQLEGDQPLDRLTQTERQILEILAAAPLPAPELGRRLSKSREHMARLMKKLYMEGYVDRESTRAPFRYKLNERLRSNLGDTVSQSQSEKI